MLNLVQWVLYNRNSSLSNASSFPTNNDTALTSANNTLTPSLSPSASPQASSGKRLIIFHICEVNNFKELEQFLQDTNNLYGISTIMLDGSQGFKVALQSLCDMFASIHTIDAVFMGVRKSDPHGSQQGFFEKTSGGWPNMMRVNSILEWEYRDVWAFLLCLQIPYCTLYDLGYTSLGCVHNTQPNPALQVISSDAHKQHNTQFMPAYMLRDGSKERDSRIIVKK